MLQWLAVSVKTRSVMVPRMDMAKGVFAMVQVDNDEQFREAVAWTSGSPDAFYQGRDLYWDTIVFTKKTTSEAWLRLRPLARPLGIESLTRLAVRQVAINYDLWVRNGAVPADLTPPATPPADVESSLRVLSGIIPPGATSTPASAEQTKDSGSEPPPGALLQLRDRIRRQRRPLSSVVSKAERILQGVGDKVNRVVAPLVDAVNDFAADMKRNIKMKWAHMLFQWSNNPVYRNTSPGRASFKVDIASGAVSGLPAWTLKPDTAAKATQVPWWIA